MEFRPSSDGVRLLRRAGYVSRTNRTWRPAVALVALPIMMVLNHVFPQLRRSPSLTMVILLGLVVVILLILYLTGWKKTGMIEDYVVRLDDAALFVPVLHPLQNAEKLLSLQEITAIEIEAEYLTLTVQSGNRYLILHTLEDVDRLISELEQRTGLQAERRDCPT